MSNVIQLPVIAGVEITTDAEGRFNLNALHRASGLGDHKRPSKWLATEPTQELIRELETQSPLTGLDPINSVKGGKRRAGTPCKRRDLYTLGSDMQNCTSGHPVSAETSTPMADAGRPGQQLRPVRSRRYILADDFLGMGGTFASLKGYIESKGGVLIAMVALTGKPRSKRSQSKGSRKLSSLVVRNFGLLRKIKADLC